MSDVSTAVGNYRRFNPQHPAHELRQARGSTVPSLPVLAEDEVAKLEAIFPPRCLRADEDVAGHHRYAGMVELVQALRAALYATTNEDEDDDEGSS